MTLATAATAATLDSSPARFDESLASVAHNLHLGPLVALALAAAALLYGWLERRGRVQWAAVPLARAVIAEGPYRRTEVVTARRENAPALVRAVAFGCLTLGHLFVPLIVIALVQYPFDGIALPLVPGLAILAFDWSCAWMLLRRSPRAFGAARAAAAASMLANVGLLAIAVVHFVLVEEDRHQGIQHACSSSVTFVVLVFAAVSVLQALVTRAMLRVDGHALRWSEGG